MRDIGLGARLNFSLIYATGTDWMESAVRELASNASLVGIQVNLAAESFNDVIGTAFDPTVNTLAAGLLGRLDLRARLPADRRRAVRDRRRPTTAAPTTTRTTTS